MALWARNRSWNFRLILLLCDFVRSYLTQRVTKYWSVWKIEITGRKESTWKTIEIRRKKKKGRTRKTKTRRIKNETRNGRRRKKEINPKKSIVSSKEAYERTIISKVKARIIKKSKKIVINRRWFRFKQIKKERVQIIIETLNIFTWYKSSTKFKEKTQPTKTILANWATKTRENLNKSDRR